jgi:hypothetical protein
MLSLLIITVNKKTLLDSHADPKTLGKEPSGNFETAKGSLPRALYRAHDKAFAEGQKTLGKEKKTLKKIAK